MWFSVSVAFLAWLSLVTDCGQGMLVTVPDTPTGENTETEIGSLRIVDFSNHGERFRRDVENNFPEFLSCDLSVSGGPIRLDLQRNRNIDVTKPVFVMRNGGIVQEAISPLKDVEYFQDTGNKAALAVTFDPRKDGSCDYRVEGIVAKGEEMFFVYPKEQQQQGEAHERRDDEFPYVVEKINPDTRNFTDYTGGHDTMSRDIPDRFRRVRRQTTKTDYNVELMMVTDASVYQFWYERTPASSPEERRSLTLSRITQYYAFVLNAIDLRYKNINETDLAFNVLYSGLLIVEDPSVSNWTDGIATNNTDDVNRPLVDADQALDSFTTWVQGCTDLPDSDHVMLFTAYDIFYDGKKKNAGLAFYGAVCGNESTSIIENRFNFNGATVAAHELGHSLGAVHDGESNACKAQDSFIMAADSGQSTNATAQNPWYFSPCSVSEFRSHMEKLDNEANNCLLNQSSDLDPTALTPLLQVLPGQKYSVDTQCAYFLGNESTFCRSLYSEASYPELCGGMFCFVPGSDTCGKTVPARGTSCAPNKWCVDGACVYSDEAPNVQGSCPFGEYPGIIQEINMTCADMILVLRVACNRDDFSQRCCESCPSVRIDIPGCPYGDWVDDCTPSDCEESLEPCCKTCYEANKTQPATGVPTTTTTDKRTPYQWKEWSGIIAGIALMVVLGPALACCLVKCRRRPKDPVATSSKDPGVEVIALVVDRDRKQDKRKTDKVT